MLLRCYLKDSEPLKPKGIGSLLVCSPTESKCIDDLTQLNPIVEEAVQHIESLLNEVLTYLFIENEVIGTDYIIYTYRVFKSKDKSYIGSCRVITYKNFVKNVTCTISNKFFQVVK